MNGSASSRALDRRQQRAKSKSHDVSVIFVHGIGSQLEGSTLEQGVRLLEMAGAVPFGPQTDDPGLMREVRFRSTSGRLVRVACIDGWWDDIVRRSADAPKALTGLVVGLSATPVPDGA